MCDFAAFIEQRKLNFEGATADSRQFETTYDSGMILIQGVTLTMPIVDSQESVSNGRCSFWAPISPMLHQPDIRHNHPILLFLWELNCVFWGLLFVVWDVLIFYLKLKSEK